MRKQILIITHDPGGYDVTYPMFNRILDDNNYSVQFICVGPAAEINPLYKFSDADAVWLLRESILQKRVALLVTGTSWGSHLELDCILSCKAAGVPTVSILDYWSNYSNRFFHKVYQQFIYPDHYIVMDEYAKYQMLKEEIPLEIIRVLGHPGLDRFIAAKQIGYSTKVKTRRVLFLSQPLSRLYGEKLGYNELTVIEELALLAKKHELELHVKFHPKDHPDFTRKFERLSVVGELSDLVPLYDVVIGMNTMGLLHSALMGKQSVSYQPNLLEEDLCISNILGLTKILTSFEDLDYYLKRMKNSEDMNNDVKQQKQQGIWMDGKSCDRVYHFIRGVIDHEN